jgi:hypothetical protein
MKKERYGIYSSYVGLRASNVLDLNSKKTGQAKGKRYYGIDCRIDLLFILVLI